MTLPERAVERRIEQPLRFSQGNGTSPCQRLRESERRLLCFTRGHHPVEEPEEVPLPFPVDFKALVKQFEEELLEEALIESRHNQTLAAELLGLSYHQLRSSLRKHGLLERLAEAKRERRKALREDTD